MIQAVILVGVNIIGIFNSAKKPVKIAPLVRDSPCPSRETIASFLVLTNTMMGLALGFKLLEAIVASLNTLAI